MKNPFGVAMPLILSTTLLLTLFLALGVPGSALADETIRAKLRGFEEVIPGQTIGAISTGARGEFRGKINKDGTEIQFELSYTGIETAVTQAHIHFGQRRTQGGVSVFLCQTTGSPDPTGHADTCPAQSGTVTGTLTEANVIGPANQGIAAGEFGELVRAIRAGVTYVNVHSTRFPSGEIRGQAKVRNEHDDHGDEHDDHGDDD
jgi:hypothetical protein